METGDCQHSLTGHSKAIISIEYSPNGNQIATASEDTTVRLWDVKTGTCSHIFIGHQNEASCVVYSPRGHQVVSVSAYDKTLRIWDTESGECRHTLTHAKEIADIAYSPRGNLIASWSNEGEARLWDVETGDCRGTIDYGGPPQSGIGLGLRAIVWISPDTDSFITGGRNGSVRVWDVTEEGDQYRIRMRWRSSNGQLGVEDACVQGVKGLSELDKRLLKQRGATGEPNLLRLRETGKNVMSMVSVISKLKPSSDTTVPNSSSTSQATSSRGTLHNKLNKRQIQRHLRTSRYIL